MYDFYDIIYWSFGKCWIPKLYGASKCWQTSWYNIKKSHLLISYLLIWKHKFYYWKQIQSVVFLKVKVSIHIIFEKMSFKSPSLNNHSFTCQSFFQIKMRFYEKSGCFGSQKLHKSFFQENHCILVCSRNTLHVLPIWYTLFYNVYSKLRFNKINVFLLFYQESKMKLTFQKIHMHGCKDISDH